MFEVKTIVKLELHNTCHRDCPEDDWYVTGYGETVQDAMTNVIKTNRGRSVDAWWPFFYCYIIKVVDVDGERFYSKTVEHLKFDKDYSNFGLPNFITNNNPEQQYSYNNQLSNFTKTLFANHPLLCYYKKVDMRFKRFEKYIQLKKDKEAALKNKKATYERLKKELENVD